MSFFGLCIYDSVLIEGFFTMLDKFRLFFEVASRKYILLKKLLITETYVRRNCEPYFLVYS